MLTIRPLTSADMPSYRHLRLAALTEHPQAFGETADEFSRTTVEHLQASLASRAEAGGFSLGACADGGELVGTVNLTISGCEKSRHRALLWGMCVASGHQRQKVGHRLLTALLERAAANAGILQIHLAVVTTNVGAITLYLRHGFATYGTDPRALRIGSAYHDEFLMVRRMR